MLRIFLPILAFFILLQSCGKVGTWVFFKANQKIIIEMYCENKAKPELECNGNCYLMKQLKKDEKKPIQIKIKEIVWFFQTFAPLDFPIFSFSFSKKLLWKICAKPILFHTDIFHPPSLA